MLVVQEGNVAFVHFAGSALTTPTRPATIAPFPRSFAARRPSRSFARHTGNGTLIGESPAMLEVGRQLRRIAPSRAPVMLVGESGTGKGLAAELLHDHSQRSQVPLVVVDCGAVSPQLLEAELFGYERGAFRGAIRQHRGGFERAAGGTLLLDEIAELPDRLQPKVLRALESGHLTRIGGDQAIPVDVRVVTATRHSPDALLRFGRLRENLLHRLAAFVVRLPPLRERGNDIELLARGFLEQINNELGTRKRFAPGSLADAGSRPWPGNVRELRNCVDRSYVLAGEDVALALT